MSLTRLKGLQVLSTLLDAGFSPTSLGNSQVTSIAEMLEHEWNAGNGLLGFGESGLSHLVTIHA